MIGESVPYVWDEDHLLQRSDNQDDNDDHTYPEQDPPPPMTKTPMPAIVHHRLPSSEGMDRLVLTGVRVFLAACLSSGLRPARSFVR